MFSLLSLMLFAQTSLERVDLAIEKFSKQQSIIIDKANSNLEIERKKLIKSLNRELEFFVKNKEIDNIIYVKSEIEKAQRLFESPSINLNVSKPEKTYSFNNHKYALMKDPGTWYTAFCKSKILGGHLVILETKQEFDFVSKISDGQPCWLGASDDFIEDKWIWINGREVEWFGGKKADNNKNLEHNLILENRAMGDATGSERRFYYMVEWE